VTADAHERAKAEAETDRRALASARAEAAWWRWWAGAGWPNPDLHEIAAQFRVWGLEAQLGRSEERRRAAAWRLARLGRDPEPEVEPAPAKPALEPVEVEPAPKPRRARARENGFCGWHRTAALLAEPQDEHRH
jgi:hypothetical protein